MRLIVAKLYAVDRVLEVIELCHQTVRRLVINPQNLCFTPKSVVPPLTSHTHCVNIIRIPNDRWSMVDPEIIVFTGRINTEGSIFEVQFLRIISPRRVYKYLVGWSIMNSNSSVVVWESDVSQRAESAGNCVSRVWSRFNVFYFPLSAQTVNLVPLVIAAWHHACIVKAEVNLRNSALPGCYLEVYSIRRSCMKHNQVTISVPDSNIQRILGNLYASRLLSRIIEFLEQFKRLGVVDPDHLLKHIGRNQNGVIRSPIHFPDFGALLQGCL